MILVLVHKLRVISLVLVAVHLVELAHIILHVALVLSGSNAKLGSTKHLAIHCRKRLLDGLAFLWNSHKTDGVLCLGKDVVAVFHLTAHIGAGRILLQFGKTGVHCSYNSVFHVVDEEILHRRLQLIRYRVALDKHLHEVHRLLLVLVNNHDRLCIVGHCLCHNWSWILGHLD